MVGADLRAARSSQSKRTARPEVGPYQPANQTGSFSPNNSNDWKNGPFFPTIGKMFRQFSNDWKKCFQSLENFSPPRQRRPESTTPASVSTAPAAPIAPSRSPSSNQAKNTVTAGTM